MSAVLDLDAAAVPQAAPAAPLVARAPAARRLHGLRWRAHGLALLSILACLALWHVAAVRDWAIPGLLDLALVPPPLEVLQAGWALLHSPRLAQHIGWAMRWRPCWASCWAS